MAEGKAAASSSAMGLVRDVSGGAGAAGGAAGGGGAAGAGAVAGAGEGGTLAACNGLLFLLSPAEAVGVADLVLEERHPLHERLGAGRAARDEDVDRDDVVYPAEDVVRVKVQAAGD